MSIYSYYFLHYFFFFNDTATTEIYTLSLHDALPIYRRSRGDRPDLDAALAENPREPALKRVAQFLQLVGQIARCYSDIRDRKSTRLNSSHGYISYAVFCLKKKKKKK